MTNFVEIPQPATQLLTVRQFAEKHQWPIGGLRHLIFYAPNGFERVIRRCGRKVLLDEQSFFTWINDINAPPNLRGKR